MSKREELARVNHTIVDGCDFTHTGLTFARIDEATLLRAGAFLQWVDRCRDWWWGDFLVAYAEFRLSADYDPKALAAMDDQTKEKHRRHYVRNHGSVTNGRERADTQVERYLLARFFTEGTRRAALSVDHHLVAMKYSDRDLAEAQDWLEKAEDAGWTRNELRAEMKAAKRPSATGEVEKITVTQGELFAAKRWARKEQQRVGDMEPEEAEAILRDLQPILQLATMLAAKVGKISHGQILPTSPGKESLRAAS